MFRAKFFEPFDNDVRQIVAQSEKVSVDALGEFRLYPVRFLP